MCRRVSCGSCGRPTFAGCGRHIDQVLGDVPVSERCHCQEKQESQSGSVGGNGPLSWLRGLLGKD